MNRRKKSNKRKKEEEEEEVRSKKPKLNNEIVKEKNEPLIKPRKNKNKPIEVSSKMMTPRAIVFGTTAPNRKSRDPRFDQLSGKFNEDLYEKSYSFIKEYKQFEIQELRKKIKKTKNPEQREELQKKLQSMEHQLLAQERKDRVKQMKQAKKAEERRAVAERGKQPFYVKKRDWGKMEKQARRKELEEQGGEKLQHHLERKRKRKLQKERKYVPWARRGSSG